MTREEEYQALLRERYPTYRELTAELRLARLLEVSRRQMERIERRRDLCSPEPTSRQP